MLSRYEEEEEFDAVTDVLAPKQVYLVAALDASSTEAVKSHLEHLSFEAGFSSQQVTGQPMALAVCLARCTVVACGGCSSEHNVR